MTLFWSLYTWDHTAYDHFCMTSYTYYNVFRFTHVVACVSTSILLKGVYYSIVLKSECSVYPLISWWNSQHLRTDTSLCVSLSSWVVTEERNCKVTAGVHFLRLQFPHVSVGSPPPPPHCTPWALCHIADRGEMENGVSQTFSCSGWTFRSMHMSKKWESRAWSRRMYTATPRFLEISCRSLKMSMSEKTSITTAITYETRQEEKWGTQTPPSHTLPSSAVWASPHHQLFSTPKTPGHSYLTYLRVAQPADTLQCSQST